jgi:hypothetical protein
MNGLTSHRRIIWIGLFLCALPNYIRSQSVGVDAQDSLFMQPVPSVKLSSLTVIDGVALLNQTTTDVAFAIEFPLGQTFSAPAPPLRTFDTTIAADTLTGSLNSLCNLDSTFSWQRIGHTVNVFPRALMKDSTYLLNKEIAVLELKGVTDAQEAVFAVADQAPGQKQQIALLQSGRSLRFAKPWTASFKNISVREAFDRIAEQVGPTSGWQFGGAEDFRVITFHDSLAPNPITTH